MGIFDRFSTLLRSNINDMISRAENPEKMLNQLIVDMKGQLGKAKSEVATAIADEKKLQYIFFPILTHVPSFGEGVMDKTSCPIVAGVPEVMKAAFTREAIAIVKNRQFIEFCERVGDKATASLYRDIIEPDERYHHELGRSLLLRLATSDDAQARAARAARRTLELAEELQRKALATAGIHHAPGC